MATRKKTQTEVPGTERESDPELDSAAADVYELTAKRQKAHDREKGARGRLLELMKAKKVKTYVYEDGEERYDVEHLETEKVSVKKAKGRSEAAE